jgi:hypothetical protein
METQPEKVKIKIDSITIIPVEYPEEFLKFCRENEIIPPKINTGIGKALSLMLNFPNNYFTRKECDEVKLKFNIKTSDSIQLFNKLEQFGIKCSEKRGRYSIKTPYEVTNKYKMRKGFKYDGTKESKNAEIDNIKFHLMGNYIEIPNEEWQLGHKNPEIEDNTNVNMVLQPPIQGKYRDNFIFIDTFTKIPTPKKLKQMIENTESPYSHKQLIEIRDFLNSLKM